MILDVWAFTITMRTNAVAMAAMNMYAEIPQGLGTLEMAP
tara:strand:- start:255 stop:374 length:120 start_codon:yes stop_codon:yes gene_type:complete